MEIILTLLGLMCLTVILVNSTPVLMIRDKFGLMDMKSENSLFKNKFIELLSCAMCLGFWVGLIGSITLLTHSLGTLVVYTSIISIGSEVINKYMRNN